MLLLLTMLLAQPALAYVPPTFHIVNMIARKHANVEDVRFRHKIIVYKRGGEVLRTFTETLVVSGSGQVTTRLADELGGELATKTRRLSGMKAGELDRPVLYDLLFVKDGASIFEHFRALGLPLKSESDLYAEKEGTMPYKPETTTAYARHENRVAVLVAAGAPRAEEREPQLWVEKDSYLPLRAILPTAPEAGEAAEPLEFRFASYQLQGSTRDGKSFLYPRVTRIYRDGALWLGIETLEVKTGTGGSLESARGKPELDGDARDFAETYFKWIR